MSKQDRTDFREDDCRICRRAVRWMRGADRPACPYCGNEPNERFDAAAEVVDEVAA